MSKQVVTKLVVNTRKRNKATTFFRPILILPILIFVSTFSSNNSGTVSISFLLAVPVLLALVFRNIYPSYIYGFNQSFLELQNRISLYALYLTDDFPSIEKSKNVSITLPDVKGGKALNRWLPLVKWFLAIPLFLLGLIYAIYALALTLVAWVTVISKGHYPEDKAEEVIKVIAYWNRLYGYALLLVTDEYPSFSLN